MQPHKLFSESHRHTARFERGMLLIWSGAMLGVLLWLLVYALQEFRPAM